MMKLKLTTKIYLLIVVSIVIFVSTLLYYFNSFLKEYYFQEAKQKISYAQGRLVADFIEIDRQLVKGLDFIKMDQSFIASVELINNYQDKNNYNAILLDEEKKEIVRQLLKRVKISLNSDISLYDKHGELIAFVYKQDQRYKLNFISYKEGKKVLFTKFEGDKEFKQATYIANSVITSEHVPYYTQKELQDRVLLTYRFIDNEIYFRSHKSLFDKDGKTSLHVEMSKLFDTIYFERISKDLNMKIFTKKSTQYKAYAIPLLSTEKLSQNNIYETEKYYSTVFSLKTQDGEIYIVLNTDKSVLAEALNKNRKELIFFISIMTIIMLIVLKGFIRYGLSKPLEVLMHQIFKINKGDYSESKIVKTSDELEEISKNINSLANAVSSREKKLIQARDQQEYLSNHDELTFLYNRRYFDKRLQDAIDVAGRKKSKLALLFLDLDQFKEVNDTLGHSVGDMLIKGVAQRLLSIIRKSDILARIGGDEFEIYIEYNNNEDEVVLFAKKLLYTISAPFNIEGYEITTTVSIGIALYPNDGLDMDTLTKNADLAMYKSKNSGRNNFHFYSDELSSVLEKRTKIIEALKIAIANENEFVVYYQPKISIKTQKVVGYEALVRWNSSQLGFVRPDEFIGIAEDTHMIVDVGRIVLRQACEDFMQLKAEGHTMHNVSVNVSSIQLQHSDMLQTVKDVIKSTGIPSNELELEMTESYIATNELRAIEVLSSFREMNIGLAIDDFGTGYSSLSYLKKLPITRLKIDKSFVDDLPHSHDSVAVVNTIISLAEAFKLKITVEGVETQEQLEFFQNKYCDDIQGYFYSKPLPFDEFKVFLEKCLSANK